MTRVLLVGTGFAWLAHTGPTIGPDSRASSALIVSVGDAANGAFIKDAEVLLPTIGRTARTKWDGEARFPDLPNGKYRVIVRALGYAPGDLEAELAGDSLGIHFALERVNPLDTVRIVETKPSAPARRVRDAASPRPRPVSHRLDARAGQDAELAVRADDARSRHHDEGARQPIASSNGLAIS